MLTENKINKTVSAILFVVLLGLSFLKDNFSPDYYNTNNAFFMHPMFHVSRIGSLFTQEMFWLAAILYSLLFIIFPYLIVTYYFNNQKISKLTFWILAAMCLCLYALIFTGNATIDKAIVPKINRYFHSPIMLMFFVATFTLIKKQETEN
ncbi:MAG: hypothetical protein WCO54_08445 [Bacteroidota bacterium]